MSSLPGVAWGFCVVVLVLDLVVVVALVLAVRALSGLA